MDKMCLQWSPVQTIMGIPKGIQALTECGNRLTGAGNTRNLTRHLGKTAIYDSLLQPLAFLAAALPEQNMSGLSLKKNCVTM